jgi:hypothetical protein
MAEAGVPEWWGKVTYMRRAVSTFFAAKERVNSIILYVMIYFVNAGSSIVRESFWKIKEGRRAICSHA